MIVGAYWYTLFFQIAFVIAGAQFHRHSSVCKAAETSSSYNSSSGESPNYPSAHSLLSGGVPNTSAATSHAIPSLLIPFASPSNKFLSLPNKSFLL
jgi:hypothetical protein